MTEELLDHSYDGIQEFDNPLPGWWKALFWITTVAAIPYAIWYHVMGNDVHAAYAAEQDAAAAIEAARIKLDHSAEGLLALMEDPEHYAAGKKLWETNCQACHLLDGGGIVGPNMTDEYFINVRKLEDVPNVVRNGVIEKGMTPWKGILSENQIAQVSAYTASLRGTTPAMPKAAQGEVIPPWPTN